MKKIWEAGWIKPNRISWELYKKHKVLYSTLKVQKERCKWIEWEKKKEAMHDQKPSLRRETHAYMTFFLEHIK